MMLLSAFVELPSVPFKITSSPASAVPFVEFKMIESDEILFTAADCNSSRVTALEAISVEPTASFGIFAEVTLSSKIFAVVTALSASCVVAIVPVVMHLLVFYLLASMKPSFQSNQFFHQFF